MFRFRALAAGACTALAAFAALPVTTAVAAPPAPCNNAPQITDASGDGHHAADRRAVGVVVGGQRPPAGRHPGLRGDARGRARRGRDPGAGLRVHLRVGRRAAIRPRDRLPLGGRTTLRPRHLHGRRRVHQRRVHDRRVESETGANGTVTIDVPGRSRPARALIGAPFVITWDGINGSDATWVDHAPGGALPTDSAAAPTTSSAPATPAPPPPGTRGHRRPPSSSARPRHVTGRKTVTVTGKVLPARAGVPVTLTRTANKKTADDAASTSAADGTFTRASSIGETSDLRAVAESIGSPRAHRHRSHAR